MRVTLISSFVFWLSAAAFAHEGETHASPPAPTPPSAVETIRLSYDNGVRPILEKACGDCHSSKTVFPWYYKIPGVRQMINQDIREAMKHIDLTPGFPFGGPHTPEQQLQGISEEITENDMPPALYRLAHRDRKLSDAERQTVLAWTRAGIEALTK